MVRDIVHFHMPLSVPLRPLTTPAITPLCFSRLPSDVTVPNKFPKKFSREAWLPYFGGAFSCLSVLAAGRVENLEDRNLVPF